MHILTSKKIASKLTEHDKPMRKVEEYNPAATRNFHTDINFFLSFYMFDDKRMIQKIGVSFSSYHRLV